MNSLFNDYKSGLLNDPQTPCLSLYLPTHRHHPDNYQDPIRFRNLLKELEASLVQKYAESEFRPLLKPFETLLADHDFWQHTLDGLAVLSAPGLFRVYRLQRPMPELAIVAESFHLKPLLRIMQSADSYHILGLNRERAVLYDGNRDVLDKVELPDTFPQTSEAVLGEKSRQTNVSAWAHDAEVGGVISGKDVKSAQLEAETERFFRAVDQAVLEEYSRPTGQRLLVAALPEQFSLFRKISRNPLLLEESIEIHPDALTIEELRVRAWSIVEPHYLARLASLVETFQVARARDQGDDDLANVARSAVAGRVATLLVEANRPTPGRLDEATGAIEFDNLENPEVDDLLDDLSAIVLKNGGEVIIVPAERMPTKTGLAAIYRF
jgi:hypothetical protein